MLVLMPLLWAACIDVVIAKPMSEGWQPTGSFKIQQLTDRCVAASIFKRGDQNLVVTLEAYPTTESYQLQLYAPGELREAWKQGKFLLGATRTESDFVVVRPSNREGTIIYNMGINRPELVIAGANPDLKLRVKPTPGDFTIAELGTALPLLDACSSDLLEHWGYSKAFQNELKSEPIPEKNWASYASPYDYPTSAIALRAQGETHALVDVAADGKASNCRVIRSSGNKEIDEATCMIVTKRARYVPARNAKGEAVAAPYYLRFRWELPKL